MTRAPNLRPGLAAALALALLPAFALLAGCAETDPYRRSGMWQPTGANTLNLAAMVATPTDLLRGRGTTGTPGIEAAPPITRYWAGKPTPLPSSTAQSAVAVNVTRNEFTNPATAP